MERLVPFIVLFPLAGFLANGLFGRKLRSEAASGWIGSGAVGLSFAAALAVFVGMLGQEPEARHHIVRLFTWVAAGSFSADVAYQADQLSIVMTLIVTGVGFLIHVYSIGYMHGDPAFWRFFAYLNLFIFMMLNLVLADNFLLMFLGWEGVGLCSYLLIGFWHAKSFDTGGYAPGAATTSDAAKKAFIVNRIGDFGFLVAMFLLVRAFGTLSFDDVFLRADALAVGDTLAVWVTLLLFLGATGKSAQIPLFVWLPDAMAGPTPVSALIHAATMVTAGVYMVARCSLLYALAPLTMQIVAVVGLATALAAATMGLVQNDIKKVLAYSTISQLGYMFLGLGVGAFAAGIFHVMTHAFFKALLFLGAGAVIHALHEEQDIRRMGGLRTAMPKTYALFAAAALAIAGIPPLAGFFSKDEILWKAFTGGPAWYWIVGWLTAALTALYMFRLFTLTFEGEARWQGPKHPHDPPSTMLVPLGILGLLSVIGGFAGVPHSLGGSNAIERWLEPVFARAELRLPVGRLSELPVEYALMALSVAAAAAGIVAARRLYLARPELAARLRNSFRGAYTVFSRLYWVDDVYDATVVRPLVRGSEKLLWKGVDMGVIDALVNGTAAFFGWAAGLLRKIQTGVAQRYAMIFVLGVVIILGLLMWR